MNTQGAHEPWVMPHAWWSDTSCEAVALWKATSTLSAALAQMRITAKMYP